MASSTKLIILAGIIFIFAAAAVAFAYIKIVKTNPQTSSSPVPSPISRFGQSPSPKDGTNGTTLGENNLTQTGVQNQPETGLGSSVQVGIHSVYIPQQLKSENVITLQSSVVSKEIVVDLKDASGKVIGTRTLNGCQTAPCQIQASVAFQNPQTQTGSIEAYAETPDGTFILPQTQINF